MNLKLTNGFNKLPDASLGVRGSQITAAMTDNENFTTPAPPVVDVTAMLATFFAALSASADGDRQKIAVKNQARQVLLNALHTWGLYVLLNSNNDIAIAMSSGFRVAKAPSPAPPVSKPLAPVLKAGNNSGSLISKGKREAQALVYLHQYATEAEMMQDHWQSRPCSKSTCILKNLTPGVKYYCRIVVVARKEQIVYSDVVSRIAA